MKTKTKIKTKNTIRRISRAGCLGNYKKEKILFTWENYVEFLHDLEKDNLTEDYLDLLNWKI